MKNETLEEAFSQYVNEKYHSPTQGSIPDLESARFGAKWQAERMFSDEEVMHIVSEALQSALVTVDLEQWFKQFKKDKL
jgi:hypothetical protein